MGGCESKSDEATVAGTPASEMPQIDELAAIQAAMAAAEENPEEEKKEGEEGEEGAPEEEEEEPNPLAGEESDVSLEEWEKDEHFKTICGVQVIDDEWTDIDLPPPPNTKGLDPY